MKGLLVKDFRLLLVQKTNMIFMLVMCVALMFMQDDVIFGACYMAILAGCLSIGTVNYDAFDNGMAFLMTLPIRRKTYVIEKYLFIILTGVISAVVMGGIGLVFIEGSFQAEAIKTVVGSGLTAVVIVAVMASLMLPVQLKFGSEKSRIVIALIAGMVFAGSALLSKAGGNLSNISLQLTGNLMVLLIVLGTLAIVAISMFISIKVLEHKEY